MWHQRGGVVSSGCSTNVRGGGGSGCRTSACDIGGAGCWEAAAALDAAPVGGDGGARCGNSVGGGTGTVTHIDFPNSFAFAVTTSAYQVGYRPLPPSPSHLTCSRILKLLLVYQHSIMFSFMHKCLFQNSQ